jgi:UDP-N-acetylmuramyl pentapeptide synthase
VALELTAGRGQHVPLAGEVTLIDGCYNANPMSTRAALEDLAETVSRASGTRAVAVLGDMLELGPSARDYHLALGEQASRSGVELLVTVGPLAAAMAERFDGEVHSVPDAAAAAELVPGLLRPGDVVLVKGSLAVGLERVCRALSARFQPSALAAANGGGA